MSIEKRIILIISERWTVCRRIVDGTSHLKFYFDTQKADAASRLPFVMQSTSVCFLIVRLHSAYGLQFYVSFPVHPAL